MAMAAEGSPDDNAFVAASSLDGYFHVADEPRLPASLEVEEVEEAEEAPPGPAAPAPDEDDDAHAPDDIEDATAPDEIEDEARLEVQGRPTEWLFLPLARWEFSGHIGIGDINITPPLERT